MRLYHPPPIQHRTNSQDNSRPGTPVEATAKKIGKEAEEKVANGHGKKSNGSILSEEGHTQEERVEESKGNGPLKGAEHASEHQKNEGGEICKPLAEAANGEQVEAKKEEKEKEIEEKEPAGKEGKETEEKKEEKEVTKEEEKVEEGPTPEKEEKKEEEVKEEKKQGEKKQEEKTETKEKREEEKREEEKKEEEKKERSIIRPDKTRPGTPEKRDRRISSPHPDGRVRRSSKDETDGPDDENPEERQARVQIPKEATTNPMIGQRRRRRAESDASLDSFLTTPGIKKSFSSSSLFVPSVVRPRVSGVTNSPISRLDTNTLVRILRYLPYKERFRCRRVCKSWLNTFMNSPQLSGHIDLSLYNKHLDDIAILTVAQLLGQQIHYICFRSCWNITDDGFQKFIDLAPNLKIVDLNSCWELTDRSVSDLGRCRHIRKLDLSNCRKVSDVTLTSILTNSVELEEIKLSYCKNLTDQTMSNICVYSRNIKVIYLQRCTSISDNGFHLLRNPETSLVNLKVLSLSDCSFLTDEAISSISMGCPELRVLNLSFCCALSSLALEYLVEGCTKLLSLDLSFCGNAVYDEGLVLLSEKLSELERLSFRSCIMVTKEGLDALVQNCKKLKYVNPSSCKNLTKDILATLPSHLKILSGNVPLHELEASTHFQRSSADGKFLG